MALPKLPFLNEDAADLMIAHFKSNFNAYLKDIDFKYSDGLSLEPVEEQSIYISDKYEALQPPAVYFLFGEMAFNYTNDENYLSASNSCVVVLSFEEKDANDMTRKAWRYARALFGIFNLVVLNSADGRLEMKCVPRRLGYSDDKVADKMSQRERKFRKDCVLELELMHFEKNLT